MQAGQAVFQGAARVPLLVDHGPGLQPHEADRGLLALELVDGMAQVRATRQDGGVPETAAFHRHDVVRAAFDGA